MPRRKSKHWYKPPRSGFPLQVWEWAVLRFGIISDIEYESRDDHWTIFLPGIGLGKVHEFGECFIRSFDDG